MQFGASIGIGPSIAGIMQNAQHQATGEGVPAQLAFVWSLDRACRKSDTLAVEVFDHTDRAADFAKRLKKQLYCFLHLTIRIELYFPGFGVHKTDG